MLIALNKPYGVLSQFSQELPGQRTLAECGLPPEIYPIGRLDADSEGLLLLTDEAALVRRLLHPHNAHPRTYLVQVDGAIDSAALVLLRSGVLIQKKKTLPCKTRFLADPHLPPRDPPIRVRKQIPAPWIELTLTEGRNRQVRKMTAAVGFPTLRLFRIRIGKFTLPTDLAPGHWRKLSPEERREVLAR